MIRAAAGRRDADQRDWLLRGTPPPPWVRWPPPLLLLAIILVQVVTPKTVDLSFLVAAVPPLAALSYGPAATAVVGGVVIMLLSLPGFGLGHPGNSDELTITFIALLSVVFAWVRSRREAQLVTVRTVAEAAQYAVLPPLRERVGRVRCAGLYEAAQHESLVGGDFFDVRRGPGGVRALVGDVQGHGLAAVGTVAALLGAFREAVLDKADLAGVAAQLDRRLVVDSAGQEHPELFATAVLLEFPDDAPVVRVVSCGHPPPLLLRGTEVTELDVSPGAPLGLGIAGPDPCEQLTVPLLAGDLVLGLTDGVSEARDASGAFYPLPDRLTAMLRADPSLPADPVALMERVWEDVVGHAGEIRDDVTMMIFAPEPEPEPEPQPESESGLAPESSPDPESGPDGGRPEGT
ncbi:PP2C family protein-serine/threonine phosphatase [Streptomyces sp. NPDC047123]|uniref:PP2C family protein-serine/threonine phosphatase n=1 Tax=Streptomyces sp. NPDC047123 TaxID=3155622 RepID=UPI0033CE2D2B